MNGHPEYREELSERFRSTLSIYSIFNPRFTLFVRWSGEEKAIWAADALARQIPLDRIGVKDDLPVHRMSAVDLLQAINLRVQ